jgi:uncharacterized protein (DUF1697 family)
MSKYATFLRGIGPGNPNMRQEKLKWFFEKLGFMNVKAVISSGNVIFESRSKNIPALESKIETGLPKYLGFKSMTIVVSQQDLEKLIKQNPFKGRVHNTHSYLLVTFFKNKPAKKLKYDRAICNIYNLSGNKGPEIMANLEKQYGKQITSRTWKTVNRIVEKFKE